MKINTLRIKIHVFVTILFFHIFLMIGSITTTHHKTTIYTSKCNISCYHFNICPFFFFISIYASNHAKCDISAQFHVVKNVPLRNIMLT